VTVPEVSARALRYWEARQAAVANNLANAGTAGFKGERVFAQLLAEGDLVARSRTNFSAGAMAPTGRDLDVALAGDGFLVVETDDGAERWTRAGSLSLSPEGVLVDGGGRAVLGASGPMVLPPGHVEITERGEILVDGEPLGRLRIERPEEDADPERLGANLWVPTETRVTLEPEEVRVLQGHLEDSNVDPVGALVEMIEIQRAYTAIQRSMQTGDVMMQAITNEIGRLG